MNSDHLNGTLESVGSKCLLTHMTPATTEEPMTAAGLVLGRCKIEHVTEEEPYVRAITRSFHDDRPSQISDEARDAVAECRVCDLLRQIQEASTKLNEEELVLKIDPAVKHWAGFVCDDDVCEVGGGDEHADFEERMYRTEEEETDAVRARGGAAGTGPEGGCRDGDAGDAHGENPFITTAHRRELFSFALLRCLDLDNEQQQMYLSSSSTIRRLRAGEEKLKQARRYYAARQSIKNAMD